MSTVPLDLVLQSALRSLALGLAVLGLLKVCRLRDVAAETLVWTVVVLSALAMPALTLCLPGIRLTLPILTLPHLALAAPIAGSAAEAHVDASVLVAALWWIYALGAAVSLARIGLGLFLTLRLYITAEPVLQQWAKGLKVRASADISSPFSFADRILLPADYWRWPRKTVFAVLAHERAHVRRGDFFIHLLASINRALFWFNPFAWWLQSHLSELAEQASDSAAVREIQDRAGYAQILVETARAARRPTAQNFASGAAMARGPGIARRIDVILAAAPEQVIAAPVRWGGLMGVILAALAVAQVRAAPAGPTAALAFVDMASRQLMLIKNAGPPIDGAPHAARPTRTRAKAAAARDQTALAQATPPAPSRSYNPRALIDDPDAVLLPALVTTGAGRAILVPELSSRTVQGE